MNASFNAGALSMLLMDFLMCCSTSTLSDGCLVDQDMLLACHAEDLWCRPKSTRFERCPDGADQLNGAVVAVAGIVV